MVDLNYHMRQALDIDEEKNQKVLEKFSKYSKNGDIFLCIVAPYAGIKITPSKEITASIGFSEEFGIESFIEAAKAKLKDSNTKENSLYLLINSPGGLVQSSYKVSRALRNSFKKIIVFVPHIAASGGTLTALAGNEIVMGMMSQLSPLDPSSGNMEALKIARGFATLTDFFSKIQEDDAPYNYKALADKYSAADIDDATANLELMKRYTKEILQGSGYVEPECEKISERLVKGCLDHSEVINMDHAKEIGLNVVPNTSYPELWETFRDWLEEYVLKSADKHIIRYWVNIDSGEANGEKAKDAKKK